MSTVCRKKVGTAATSSCRFYVPLLFSQVGPVNPGDPTTVTLKFGPTGQPPTLWTFNSFGSITRQLDTSGFPFYFAEILGTAPGDWVTQWQGTGAIAVVDFGQITFEDPPF